MAEVSPADLPPTRARLAALTATVGRAFAELYGTTTTRLHAALSDVGTEALVESVHEWPAEPGICEINGERIEFANAEQQADGTGKLTGLVRDENRAKLHPVGSLVDDAGRRFSRRDRARQDSMLTLASGEWLHVQARNLGLTRPPWPLSDDHLREFFRVVAYLDAGTHWAVWRVLEAALEPWHKTAADGVTASAAPQRLTVTAGTFGPQHLHRYIRIGDKYHRISNIAGDGSWVDLFPGGGPWWSGVAFEDDSPVTWKLLAFLIEEDPAIYPAKVAINLFVPASVSTSPPTYLQPAGAVPTPGGDPKGGELMADENEAATADNQPLYLGGEFGEAVKLMLRDLLVLGAQVVTIKGSE